MELYNVMLIKISWSPTYHFPFICDIDNTPLKDFVYCDDIICPF